MLVIRSGSIAETAHGTVVAVPNGLSWTANIDVARGFAGGIWRTFKGGSVIVTTMAPSGAIISVPGARDDHYEEEEYLVDRRNLKVDVVERLSQITI
jgi:hypothetical protein